MFFTDEKKMFNLLLKQHCRQLVIFSREEFGGEDVWLSQNVFEKQAEVLCCDTTFDASEISRLKVVDEEDDFIVTDGEWVKVVEAREEKPDFGGVVSNGSIGISTRVEGGGNFDEQMLPFRIKRRSFQIVF
jgi:hypothetical protein